MNEKKAPQKGAPFKIIINHYKSLKHINLLKM